MSKHKTTNNAVKKALLERRLTFGSWIQIGHPTVAEILSRAGFEWLAIDMEHTDIDTVTFCEVARGMHGRGAIPMARVRENDVLAIRQVLDAGAQGVIVPLINSAREAEKAVKAAKYPPQGVRGFAFCRANDWGIDFDEYAQEANRYTAVIVMIESRQAVENINEILSVDGVDGVFIGPYDMSGSYGVTGQTSHPAIVKACRTVSAACEKHGKSAGFHIVRPDKKLIKNAIDNGFTFIALGMDTVFLDETARHLIITAKQMAKKMKS